MAQNPYQAPREASVAKHSQSGAWMRYGLALIASAILIAVLVAFTSYMVTKRSQWEAENRRLAAIPGIALIAAESLQEYWFLILPAIVPGCLAAAALAPYLHHTLGGRHPKRTIWTAVVLLIGPPLLVAVPGVIGFGYRTPIIQQSTLPLMAAVVGFWLMQALLLVLVRQGS